MTNETNYQQIETLSSSSDLVFKSIQSANTQTAAVITKDGVDHVYNWGKRNLNEAHQVVESNAPIDKTPVMADDDYSIKSATSGWYSSSFIMNDKKDGSGQDHLYMYGRNTKGQLGNGNTAEYFDYPTDITPEEWYGKTIRTVVESENGAYAAIIEDGSTDELWMWGAGSLGEMIGSGNVEYWTPTLIGSLPHEEDVYGNVTRGVKQIVASTNTSSFIMNVNYDDGDDSTLDDHVYVWGENQGNNLGLGEEVVSINTPADITPAGLDPNGEIQSVTLNHDNGYFVFEDSENYDHFYSWGRDSYGQLVNGQEESITYTVPTESFSTNPEDESYYFDDYSSINITDVYCNWASVIIEANVVDVDSSTEREAYLAGGLNRDAETGLGSNYGSKVYEFTEVKIGSGNQEIKIVSPQTHSTLVVTNDGTKDHLWATGLNEATYGDGTNNSSWLFKEIDLFPAPFEYSNPDITWMITTIVVTIILLILIAGVSYLLHREHKKGHAIEWFHANKHIDSNNEK